MIIPLVKSFAALMQSSLQISVRVVHIPQLIGTAHQVQPSLSMLVKLRLNVGICQLVGQAVAKEYFRDFKIREFVEPFYLRIEQRAVSCDSVVRAAVVCNLFQRKIDRSGFLVQLSAGAVFGGFSILAVSSRNFPRFPVKASAENPFALIFRHNHGESDFIVRHSLVYANFYRHIIPSFLALV